MINLGFFPSRRLALYMVRLFLTRSFAVLFALILVLETLDLLGEAGKILAVHGNGDAALWHYVALRIPLLISRFLPFSVLLGTLIAFVGLNQNSEVVAMKSAGLSAHQILAPLILASIGISALLFVFNERVVVNSARIVNAWSDNDYKPIPPAPGMLSNVWVLDGDDFVRAGMVLGHGAGMTLRQVSYYDRTGGVLQRVINADTGRPLGGGWLLHNVTIYDANQNVVRDYPAMNALPGRFRCSTSWSGRSRCAIRSSLPKPSPACVLTRVRRGASVRRRSRRLRAYAALRCAIMGAKARPRCWSPR